MNEDYPYCIHRSLSSSSYISGIPSPLSSSSSETADIKSKCGKRIKEMCSNLGLESRHCHHRHQRYQGNHHRRCQFLLNDFLIHKYWTYKNLPNQNPATTFKRRTIRRTLTIEIFIFKRRHFSLKTVHRLMV